MFVKFGNSYLYKNRIKLSNLTITIPQAYNQLLYAQKLVNNWGIVQCKNK